MKQGNKEIPTTFVNSPCIYFSLNRTEIVLREESSSGWHLFTTTRMSLFVVLFSIDVHCIQLSRSVKAMVSERLLDKFPLGMWKETHNFHFDWLGPSNLGPFDLFHSSFIAPFPGVIAEPRQMSVLVAMAITLSVWLVVNLSAQSGVMGCSFSPVHAMHQNIGCWWGRRGRGVQTERISSDVSKKSTIGIANKCLA